MTDAEKLVELEKALNDCNMYYKKLKKQQLINWICFISAFVVGAVIGWVIL